MKIGIYISGLGQAFVSSSIEKYAEHLMNEMDFNTNGIEYSLKSEKITFASNQESTVISICEKNMQSKVVYKIYEFNYHEILTAKYKDYSLLLKNLRLFLLVLKKIPIVIKRLFAPASYNRTFETLYLFFIFMIMACAVLLMLPATFSVISKSLENNEFLKHLLTDKYFSFISTGVIDSFSKIIVALTSLILLVVPNANTLIADLATEYVCVNDYIQYGVQKQLLQGNLELLFNYITENEPDCKIHFHTYSFGCVLAIDYLYPYGNKVSKNAELFCEALITIGCPFEFIRSYYPKFYLERETQIGNKIQWLNVYSLADALATNFRKDSKKGDSEFGIGKNSNKPVNINYEVVAFDRNNIVAFLMLYSLKAHCMYWGNEAAGLSCLGLVYDEMNSNGLI